MVCNLKINIPIMKILIFKNLFFLFVCSDHNSLVLNNALRIVLGLKNSNRIPKWIKFRIPYRLIVTLLLLVFPHQLVKQAFDWKQVELAVLILPRSEEKLPQGLLRHFFWNSRPRFSKGNCQKYWQRWTESLLYNLFWDVNRTFSIKLFFCLEMW